MQVKININTTIVSHPRGVGRGSGGLEWYTNDPSGTNTVSGGFFYAQNHSQKYFEKMQIDLAIKNFSTQIHSVRNELLKRLKQMQWLR